MFEKIRAFFETLDASTAITLIMSFTIDNYLAIGYFFIALYSIKHKMRMIDKNQILEEKKVENDVKKLDVELERLRLENDKLRIENTKLEAEVDTVEINNDKLKNIM
jgi:cell division protein FtsB